MATNPRLSKTVMSHLILDVGMDGSLARALLLGRCLKNWLPVSIALRRSLGSPVDRKEAVDLHFRSGLSLKNVEPQSAFALLHYYDFSRKWMIYSNQDLETLSSVAADISKKLTTKFTRGEIERCSTGACLGTHAAFLFLIVRRFKPVRVVETGVAQGVSSYTILEALKSNGQGKLVSVDFPNRNPEGYLYPNGTCDRAYVPKELMPGWMVPDELRRFWELKIGQSKDVLPTIEGNIDLFHHDSEHSYENMTYEYEWAYNRLGEGGILASDDIDWNNAFSDFARSHPEMKPLIPSGLFPALIKTESPRTVAAVS